jgi:DNA-binding response OmpR family regulator
MSIGQDAQEWTGDNTNILKLRKKLEDTPANPKYILSVYGGGYMFAG